MLGLYVREKRWLTLPEAIRKMTALPAARLGVKDRGLLRAGMKADLVLFDPATVIDHSTFEQPRALATGIAKVWVNGGLVWTGTAPGAERTGPRAHPVSAGARRFSIAATEQERRPALKSRRA